MYPLGEIQTSPKQNKVQAPESEIPARKQYLADLDKNLDTESLCILAEKSRKPGIGKKLKQFKNLI